MELRGEIFFTSVSERPLLVAHKSRDTMTCATKQFEYDGHRSTKRPA